MKRVRIILMLLCIIFARSFSETPTNFSANYIGDKMWNSQRMVPYYGSVSLEIIDSIAYLKHYWNSEESVDSFIYQDIHNGCFRYVRKKNRFTWEFLSLSKDPIKLQVGEPMGVNYFYKLESISSSTVCPECLGIGEVRCPRCQGTGCVSPNKNRNPDETVWICPLCHGTRYITHSSCMRCNGTGRVEVRKQNKH